jgi:hypothetical protein
VVPLVGETSFLFSGVEWGLEFLISSWKGEFEEFDFIQIEYCSIQLKSR